MNELNRRELIRHSAVGAALAGTASAMVRPEAGPASAGGRVPSGAMGAVSGVAAARDHEVVLPEACCVEWAAVSHARSLGREVYLTLDGGRRGFVELGPEGFAIAVACQAAGRPVAVRCWGHEPAACMGAGRFLGAVVAVEAGDVPGARRAEA